MSAFFVYSIKDTISNKISEHCLVFGRWLQRYLNIHPVLDSTYIQWENVTDRSHPCFHEPDQRHFDLLELESVAGPAAVYPIFQNNEDFCTKVHSKNRQFVLARWGSATGHGS